MAKAYDFDTAFLSPALQARVAVYLSRGHATPFKVDLDLTSDCNYRCSHCGDLARGLLNHGGLALEVVQELIEDFVCLGVAEVCLIGGGEPTASPVFTDTLMALHGRGIRTGVTTNGSLIDDHKVMAMAWACDWVRFSLDACTSATYERIHRPKDGATFEGVVESLTRLASLMPGRVGVSFLVMRSNLKELAGTAELAKNAGAAHIRIRQASHPRTGVFLPLPDPGALELELRKAKALESEHFQISIGDSLLLQLGEEILPGQPKCYRCCHAQAFHVTIAGDGSVYVCSKWRGESWAKLGNVREESLVSIWNGPRRAEVVRGLDPSAVCAHIYCHAHKYNEILDQAFEGRRIPLNAACGSV